MTWKTIQEWNDGGRFVKKGEKCKLRDPDGKPLFNKTQTKKSSYNRWDSDYFGNGVDYDYDNHEYGECMYGN